MFKQSISVTPLTSESANLCFQNITGEDYCGDTTFIATLRALVAPRLPEGESLHLYYGSSDFHSSAISEMDTTQMVRMICDGMYVNRNAIYIHSLKNREEASNVACIELLKNSFAEVYTGWEYVSKVETFYHKSFRVICFVNPEMKTVALFVEQLNLQKLHYLQMATLAILPWYFNAENGVAEIEMELLKSLRERTSEHYAECLKKIASGYDFETARIKNLLTGFEIKYERMEVEREKRELNNIDEQLRRLDESVASYLFSRNEHCIRLMGLQQRIAEGGGQSEIMDYFICNRKLFLENVSDTHMYFCVRDYLTYFDEEAASTYIKSKRSYFYSRCGGKLTEDAMKKLLTAIFIEQEIKLRFCAAYVFDLNGCVVAQQHHRFGPEFDDYRPNPHIDRYRCIGNYERTINNALKKRDYIQALEQCVASAKSLNLHDSPVMEEFVSKFCANGGSSFKCLELPDGRVVSPVDAIAWIEECEAAERAKTEQVSERAEVPADVAERVAEAVETEAPATAGVDTTDADPTPF